MTYEELLQENHEQKLQIAALQFRLDQLERAIRGSRRERFVPDNTESQITLFEQEITDAFNAPKEAEKEEQPVTEVRKRKPKKVNRNTFPAHLLRVESLIQPEDYQEGFKKIGQDVTEILKYTPLQLEVLKIVRPRYTDPHATEDTIHQANIPPRIIPRGLVDDSVVAGLITEKFEYHMPVFRFVKKMKNAGIDFIHAKHCYNYLAKAGELMQPIHALMHKEVLNSKYVQMDESGIRVLSQDKEHGKQRGCMWVMFAPTSGLVLFNYRPSKEKHHAYDLLDGYKGVLQSDGNSTYQSIADVPPEVKIMGRYSIQLTAFLNCWAHTRRKFYEAKDLDPTLINPILVDIQQLYAIEKQTSKENLTAQQCYDLRQEYALPVLDAIKEKLDNAILTNLTGPVKTAIQYTIKRWSQLSNYISDGNYKIDTNLLENKIRLLALGRKNYLFAKTDETAQHIATFYSIVATCQAHGLNTFDYLCWLFRKINTEKITDDATYWLPHKVDRTQFEDGVGG